MVAKERFLEFVANVLDVPAGEISLGTEYESIPQWDSVMHLRLVMELASEYGADIPIEKVPEIKTLGAFYDFIKD